MIRRGVFDAALVAAVGVGWGLLGPATKVLFVADPAAFDGVSVAVARAVWALPVFVASFAVFFARERPRLARERWLAMPEETVRPTPLLTGRDLIAEGYPPGPAFKRTLRAVEDAQLEGTITTKEEALRLAIELLT